MKSKSKKQAGALQTIIDNEIAAGCARLNIRSRKELFAEADLHPGIEEHSEIYQFMPAPFVARVRALELLTYLTLDNAATGIADLDDGIRELREVLPTVATEIPET